MRSKKVELGPSEILGRQALSREPAVGTLEVERWRRNLSYLSVFAGVATIAASQAATASAKEPDVPATQAVPARVSEIARKLRAACSTPELLRRQAEYRLSSQKGTFNMFSLLAGSDNCPGTPIPNGTYTAAAPFTDSGSTTGANNTVTAARIGTVNCIEGYAAAYSSVQGPDHIYSFTLTARGAAPRITVTPGNATYDTAVYILSNTGAACPAGTGNSATNCLAGTDVNFDNSPEEINTAKMNALPLNVPLYLFIDSFYPNATPTTTNNGPYTVRIQDVTIAGAPGPPDNDAPMDINGDGKTDYVVLRNVGGGSSGQVRWYTSVENFTPVGAVDWGLATDQFFADDYDGDGKDDFAVYRPGTQGAFYILRSQSNTVYTDFFGGPADDATVVGDYTGDGRADLALYRGGATPSDQSFWYYRSLGSSDFVTVAWGQGGDTPAPGDYDGDGKNDFVIQRAAPDNTAGIFWKLMNSGAQSSEIFGLKTDTVVPGDYDDDGKTDLAVVRDDGGTLRWDFEPSGTAGTTVVSDTWGVSATDWIVAGDYDGDGKTDYAVWRPGSPGTFYVMTVGDRRITSRQWGEASDIPALYYSAF